MSDVVWSHWDKNAARYDRAVAPLERRFLAASREWIAGRAAGRVLEIAVGTGLTIPYYRQGVALVGLDLSEAMLAHARRRGRDTGHRFVVGDAMALPFATASFDTVVCAYGLCEVRDLAEALGECRRVLHPDGRLLLADHVVSSIGPVRAVQRAVETWTIRSHGEHLTRRPLLALPEAGFVVVETRRRALGMLEDVMARPQVEGVRRGATTRS